MFIWIVSPIILILQMVALISTIMFVIYLIKGGKYDDDDEAWVAVEWANETFNFDTVPLSLRTIYVLATLDEWTGKTRHTHRRLSQPFRIAKHT